MSGDLWLPIIRRTRGVWLVCVWLVACNAEAAFNPGDLVRLCRNETLLLKGESFLPAPRGQEFTVYKQDQGRDQVHLVFIQKDGGLIAVTLPESVLELVPPTPWTLLQKGCVAFAEQRFDDAKKNLQMASSDADYKALTGAIQARMDAVLVGARAALGSANEVRNEVSRIEQQFGGSKDSESVMRMRVLLEAQRGRLALALRPVAEAFHQAREMAFELDRKGYVSLALGVDDGLERLSTALLGRLAAGDGGQPLLAATKLNRTDAQARVSRAAFSLVRCRQAMAVRRMVEASGYVKSGLEAEPAHHALKRLAAKVDENLKDADDRYNAAYANRSGRNLNQGLLALERGLKICADHPKLSELRAQMAGVLEESTSPPVTSEMVGMSKKGASKELLEEGRKLYVNRCNECHDLEMLDSRSDEGWRSMVRKMAGKAHLRGNQEELILQYLSAAKESVASKK